MEDPFITYFDEYQPFSSILTDDVTTAEQELQQQDTQTRRRSYIRAVFAFFEGDIFQRKRLVLIRRDHMQEEFEEAQVALLREEQYELTQKGEIRVQPKFLKLTDNLLFSFKALAQALGVDFEPDLGGRGWDSFRKAVKVRNRLMHPKQLEELEVSDQDLQCVRTALTWYRESVSGLEDCFTKQFDARYAYLLNKQGSRP